MAPAGVEPAPRRLRVGRSPLSYGADDAHSNRDVAGRDRTCGAPRFKRQLYRAELRPRGMGEAGFEPATSCVLDKHSGQAELLAHVKEIAPGQGFEPRSPRSERGVLPDRRSRITRCISVQLPRDGSSTQRRTPFSRAVVSFDVTFGRQASLRRTMFSMPLAYPSTLDRRPSVALSATVVVLRGGALEPDAQ